MLNKCLHYIFFISILFPVIVEGKDGLFYPEYEDSNYDIVEYINSFPFQNYEICKAGNHNFYVDKEFISGKAFDGIKSHIAKGIVWEPYLISYIKKYCVPGSTVLDIGAHMGTHTLFMSNFVGDYGKVIAIEPQLKLFRELFMNLKLNNTKNVQIMRYAVGNKNGEVQMNTSAKNNEGGTGVGSGGDYVEMVPIDQFNFLNVSLMKIDVEGLEDSVLEGARATIEINKPIIMIEIMGGNIYETAPDYVKKRIDATKKILNDMGYQVINIAGHDYLATPNL